MSSQSKHDRLISQKQVNLNKQDILKDMETKINNPPIPSPTTHEALYTRKLREDLYTITELHMQMLLTEARAIDQGLYAQKLKEKQEIVNGIGIKKD